MAEASNERVCPHGEPARYLCVACSHAEVKRLRAALERITECTEHRDGGEGIQVIAGSSREFWYAIIAAKELTHWRPADETAACTHDWTLQVDKADFAIYCCENCGKFVKRIKETQPCPDQ